MKVFVDSNVWIAAYISAGLCHELIDHLQQRHTIIVSQQVLEEFERALIKKVKADPKLARAEVQFLARLCRVVETPVASPAHSRDPDDDSILQAALDADVDWIVSGDQDLTVLKQFNKIPINSPREFLNTFGLDEELKETKADT